MKETDAQRYLPAEYSEKAGAFLEEYNTIYSKLAVANPDLSPSDLARTSIMEAYQKITGRSLLEGQYPEHQVYMQETTRAPENVEELTIEQLILPIGTIFRKHYDPLIVTGEMLDEVVNNFGNEYLGVPFVDVDHAQTISAGDVVSLWQNDDGLMAKIKFNKFGTGLVKDKEYTGLSVTIDTTINSKTGQSHRNVLTSISLTNKPAVKKEARIRLDETVELSTIPYKKYEVVDEPWDGPAEMAAADVGDLKIMCAWYDPENADNKGAYKLHHHRQSDKKVVKAAISAARGALSGARNGVKGIPEDEKAAIMAHLDKHWKDWEDQQKNEMSTTHSDGNTIYRRTEMSDTEKTGANVDAMKTITDMIPTLGPEQREALVKQLGIGTATQMAVPKEKNVADSLDNLAVILADLKAKSIAPADEPIKLADQVTALKKDVELLSEVIEQQGKERKEELRLKREETIDATIQIALSSGRIDKNKIEDWKQLLRNDFARGSKCLDALATPDYLKVYGQKATELSELNITQEQMAIYRKNNVSIDDVKRWRERNKERTV